MGPAQWVSDAFLQIPYPCGFAATTNVSRLRGLRRQAYAPVTLRVARSRCSVLTEMLREAEALALVIRANALPVHGRRRLRQAFENETADDLAVLQDERHLAASHFEDRACATAMTGLMAETGVE